MRIPDPKANTTTEAYLAYKAGYLEESELKPVLYEPYLHFDAWLAYWAGLVPTYPVKEIGKNLLSTKMVSSTPPKGNPQRDRFVITCEDDRIDWVCNVEEFPTGNGGGIVFEGLNVKKGKTYTLSFTLDSARPIGNIRLANNDNFDSGVQSLYSGNQTTVVGPDLKYTFTANNNWSQLRLYIWSSVASPGISNTGAVIKPQLELGSNKTTYETFSGKPDMLCDEEALVAYLSGVTNTYPEEIKDPYDVRIVGYLKYLVSARWGRPEYPVNNEEFYLSTMKPPVVPSGDTPSSDIEMDDTAEAPFIDLKMYGDTSQTTYTGKNLFNNKATPLYNNKASAEALPTGVRITTTNTAGGYCFVVFKICDASDYEGQTITLKTNMASSSTNPARLYIGLSDANGTDRVAKVFLDASGSCSYTIEQDPDRPCVIVALYSTNSGSAVLDEYVDYTDLQIEVGSTATSYEPYVGGVPAPNPDYPQDVNVVTGEQTVTVSRKNRLNPEVYQTGVNIYYPAVGFTFTNTQTSGISCSYTDTEININTSIQHGSGAFMSSVLSAGTYHFSATVKAGSNNNARVSYSILDANRTVIDKGDYGTTQVGATRNYNWTINVPNNGVYIAFSFATSAVSGGEITVSNPQLEAGSTTTSYEPYQSQSYEINLDGKNLFNINTLSDGWFNISGKINEDSSWKHTNYIPIQPSTAYTTSGFVNGSGINPARCYYDANKVFISAVKHNNTEPVTDVSPSNAHYMIECCKTVDINTLQIELGSTATSYAPYRTPIELCKIGDYQDYIYRDEDGDWYLHKATEKMVLDGSDDENWILQASSSTPLENRWFEYRYLDIPTDTSYEVMNLAIKIDKLVTAHPSSINYTTTVEGFYVMYANGSLRVRWDMQNILSVASFRTWLSSNELNIYYPIATPTDTKITDATLIGELNALMEGGSYNGKTYIKVTATEPNLPGLLYVEAGKYD